MSTAAAEMTMQMQPLLSDLHRFLGTCVKNAGEKDLDLLVLRPTAPTGLKYFGQSKVAAAANSVETTNTKAAAMSLPVARGAARIPTAEKSSIKNHKDGDQARRHDVQLRIDLLTRVSAKLAELNDCSTPTSSLYDQYKNLSPKNGAPLPRKLPSNWRPAPGLEPVVSPDMLSKIPTDGNWNYDFNHSGSQASTADNTPQPSHIFYYNYSASQDDMVPSAPNHNSRTSRLILSDVLMKDQM